jgi:hypothetical protein
VINSGFWDFSHDAVSTIEQGQDSLWWVNIKVKLKLKIVIGSLRMKLGISSGCCQKVSFVNP